MISKLRNPDNNVERAIQNLYDKVNEIITAVNQESVSESSGKSNEKIRLVKKADNTYSIQLKFKDGWVESDSSEATGFKLKGV